MKVTYGIEGLEEVAEKIKAMAKDWHKGAGAVVYEMFEKIMDVSISMTPIDSGDLRSSAYISPPQHRGDFVFIEAGYGSKYAKYVHERTDVRHDVGEAKFMTKAIHKMARKILRIARERMRDYISGRVVWKRGKYPERPRA